MPRITYAPMGILLGLALIGGGCGGSKPTPAEQAPSLPSPQATTTPQTAPVTSTSAVIPTAPTTTTGTSATKTPSVPKPTTTRKTTTTAPQPQSATVLIKGSAFSPQVIAVYEGDSVVWVNKDSVSHTTRSDGVLLWDSGNLAPGQSYRRTFNASGSYQYSCGIHSSMRGTVIVNPRPKL